MKQQFNLGILSQKQLDFYHFCKAHPEFLVDLTIVELAKKFGCGISFIYIFFTTLNVKNYKEFIFLLAQEKSTSQVKDQDELLVSTINSNIANHLILNTQLAKIKSVCELMQTKRKILCLGFGHSKLAINDLFGTLTKFPTFAKRCVLLNDERPEYINNLKKVSQDDLLIIYSMRVINPKIQQVLNTAIKNGITTVLITSNVKSNFANKVSICIEVDNNVRRITDIAQTILTSPLISYLYFNNVLKSKIFEQCDDKTEIKTEIKSWIEVE